MRAFYIALFGLLGVFSRYYLGLGVNKILPAPFPYGTFLINMTGAFLIGVVHVLGVERATISSDLRMGIVVGFLGGYTTFSTYCLEAVKLTEEAKYGYAALYFLVSPILGCLAVLCGMFLTRLLLVGFISRI